MNGYTMMADSYRKLMNDGTIERTVRRSLFAYMSSLQLATRTIYAKW